MRLLLDTHVLIWAALGSDQLSAPAREALLDPATELHWSAASQWEIAIKVSLGKLVLRDDWDTVLRREMQLNRIRRLGIEDRHCVEVAALPFHHRDPFDRMLIAQCRVEGLSLLSRDAAMHGYDVEVVW